MKTRLGFWRSRKRIKSLSTTVRAAGVRGEIVPEVLEDRRLLAANAIVLENQLPGSPASEWDIVGSGDPTLQGYATQISVDQGQTVSFKIDDTDQAPYHLDIYRMGYYGGLGARKVATVPSSQTLRQAQPAPLRDDSVGLVDAGNWSVSASWAVPADATSGIYFAKATREDTGGSSHIVFVVRNDDGHSDMLFQTSDTTWQAYNDWGGNSLYTSSLPNLTRAYKVSYNRPFHVRGTSATHDWVFATEYPMVRWLESNGYDVSYFTGYDSDRLGGELLEHKTFLSVGHDEYWSGQQRRNVEAARDAGVSLAFFSGNEVYWKTRWESSIDATGTPHQTMVSYKESKANAKIDPSPEWTGVWRDDRFKGSDYVVPENALEGTIFTVNRGSNNTGIPITVPAADGKMRFWRGTSVATLAAGTSATLSNFTLGYEWDEDLDNGYRPTGLIRLSTTTDNVIQRMLDQYGNSFGPAQATHSLTLYRAGSGALVFGAGTVQWSWGLDGTHDILATVPDVRMQQATVNLFADMNVQPETLQPGLVEASPSTDLVAPTVTITSLTAGQSFAAGVPVTISGTAQDSGGGVVGGVEVSVDGGGHWHRADGRETWQYVWTPAQSGAATIMARASDDSVNVGAPVGVGVTVFYQPTSTTGLAAAYNFNEGAGGTLRDRSGNLNDGAITGALWTSAGRDGGALSFDGAGDMVTIADSDTLDLTSGMTLEAWVKPAGTGGWQTALLKERDGGLVYSLYVSDDTLGAPIGYVRIDTSDNKVQQPAALPANQWSHLALTYDGQTLRQYLNGIEVARRDLTGPIVTSTGALRIGGDTVFGGEYFNGLMDDVRVYSRPLSAGEINADLSTPVGGTIDTVAPAVSVSAPASGNSVSGTATLSATATDNAAVAGVQLFLNGSPVGNELTAAPFSFSWNSTAVANGTYVLTARARDVAGNATTSAGVSFSVNNPPDSVGPTVKVTNPAGGETVVGTLVLNAVATDNVGVAGLRFRVNGADLGPELTATPYRMAWDTSTLPSGVYDITAVARDRAGNLTTSAPVSVTVDNTPPQVVSTSPAAGTSGVVTSATLSATFSKQVKPTGITWNVRTAGGLVASGRVSFDSLTNTSIFTPDAPLATSQTYTATVSGAVDKFGRPMAQPATWSFSTSPRVTNATVFRTQVPGVLSANDGNATELGMKFRSDVAGEIAAIRFFKGSTNTGTHVGHLWTASGQLLATVTFTGETGTGWQQANLDTPVQINPNTTYVVSYYAPVGRYSLDAGGFGTQGVDSAPLHALAAGVEGPNGVFVYATGGGFPTNGNNSNYFVDVVFNQAITDTVPPTVVSTSPAAGTTGSPTGLPVIATFSEDVDPQSITFVLRGPGGSPVSATVSYDGPSKSATLRPASPLAAGTTYTATVSGAVDLEGNAMAAPLSWSFTTTATSDTTPPQVFSQSPANGSTNVATGVALTFTFSESVQAGTVNVVLKDASGATVPGTFTYDDASFTGRFVPAAPLEYLTTYTATVSGARDLAGNAMAAPFAWSFTTLADVINPTVVSTSPADGDAHVLTTSKITVLFSERVQASSISMVLRNDAGVVVATSLAYDDAAHTATLTPAVPLKALSTFTVTLSGVLDRAGNSMGAPRTWSFSTASAVMTFWTDSTIPAVTSANDKAAVELGLRFRSDVSGTVTGVRFYKGAGNFGTHVGNLWTATGTLLATATFTDETASGWQQVSFASPVNISADTVYVVSYFAPLGHYAVNSAYFSTTGLDNGPLHAPATASGAGNGLFKYGASSLFPTGSVNGSNYWVDVIFHSVDNSPPAVVNRSPAPSSSDVLPTVPVTVTFNEKVQSDSISLLLTDADGAAVPATLTYDPATLTATLTPSSSLALSTSYTVTLGGVTDLAGNTSLPVVWSFTTTDAPSYTFFPSSAVPAVPATNDGSATEVGLRFRSDRDALVTGVRFYKGATNTGTHVGHLWTAAGALLATATFTGESASGWQQVSFSQPVPISAGVTYVVSYFAPVGRYSSTADYFTTSGTDSGPMHAPASAAGAGNGLYVYSATGGFPVNTFKGTNYWVDVVLKDKDQTPPVVISRSPAPTSPGVLPGGTVSVTFNEDVQPGTVSLVLRDSAANVVPGTLSYDPATRTATFTPSATLSFTTAYTATASGARDARGNLMAETVWSFTTMSLWQQTSATDFAAGSNDFTAVANSAGGEVVLGPGITDGFDGPDLGAGWTVSPWSTSGTTSVSGGIASGWAVQVLSARSATSATVDGRVAFGAVANQHFGIATNLSAAAGNSWAIFSTKNTTNTLFARVNVSGTQQEVTIGALPAGFHQYKVQPGGGAVRFYVDGVLKATITATLPSTAALRAAFSAFSAAPQPPIQVDSITFTPWSGVFTSSVFDAGATTAWGSASWTAGVPAGTSLLFQTSSGNTATPDGTWSAWAALGAGGAVASPSARYLRYRVTLTGDSVQAVSPVLYDVTIGWVDPTKRDIAPPALTTRSPAPDATGVAIGAPVTATFNEDLQPSTLSFALTDAAGNPVAASFVYDPETKIATLTPASPLAYGSTYTATVSGAEDVDGNTMGPWTWSFTTVAPPDTTAPVLTAVTPAAGATGVGVSSTLTATFNEAMAPGTGAFALTDSAGNTLTLAVTYSSSARRFTLTPTAPLAFSTTYTVTVTGAQDLAGNPMSPASWSFTTVAAPDVTPPAVTARSPGVGATGVPILAVVTATFGEAVQPGSATAALTDSAGNAVAASVAFDAATNTLTLTPSSGLAYSTTYTATVSGAADAVGNVMAPLTWSFTTAAPPDTTAPALTSVSPAAGATGVAASSAFAVTFSEAIQFATLSLVLTDAAGNVVAGSAAYDAASFVVTFTPASPLAYSTTYTATVSGAADAAGNVMTGYACSFTTAAPPDTTAPTVSSRAPASGATGVSISAVVTASFSEGVTPASVSFVLTDGAGNAVAAALSYDAATNTATLAPSSPLAYSTTYTATVGGASDAAGNVMSAVTWSFTTAAPPDTTAPTVTARTPASGATGVSTTTAVTVTFSEPVDPATLSLVLKDGAGATIPATLGYDAATNTATLTPSAALAYSTAYTATAGASDLAGNAMSAAGWSFTTAAPPDTTAPTLTARTPASGATGVATTAAATATFSEAVQPATVSFVLKDAAGNAVAATVAYDAAANVATLTPTSALAYSTTYTATVSGAKDLAGNTMALTSWSFTTAAPPDTTAPTVTARTPASGATGVAVATAATATFSEAIQPATLSFVLKNAAGVAVTATVSYDAATNTATLTPSAALAYSTTYTATVSGAKDLAGNTMVLTSWSFTTAAPPDVTAPTITTRSPAANATGVAATSVVTATFSEAIQPATLSFVLKDAAGVTVPATVTYNAATNTATLTPSAALGNDVLYTVTVSGAKDLAGNTMASSSWSFRTLGSITQTAASDFTAGTLSGTSVANATGGELQLANAFVDNFSATSLDAALWSTSSWVPSGGGPTSVTMSGGILTVRGAAIMSTQTAIGVSVEARATFGAATDQFIGLANSLTPSSTTYAAGFTTASTTDTLYARVYRAGTLTDVKISKLPTGYHTYRVTPTATGFQFYVDGSLAKTVNGTVPAGTPFKMAMSAFKGTPSPALLVDSIRMVSTATSGQFTSSVLDARRAVTWGTIRWTQNLPAGTTVVVEVRSGNTASPDGTWSAWKSVTNGGSIGLASSRYIQYRITLTSTNPAVTPTVLDLTLDWS